MNLRLVAARILNDVTNGHSLSDCLSTSLPKMKDARDRAFVQAMCYGVCRSYARIDVILSYLLQKPMKAKDSDVHALLMIGLYQLIEMRIPEYAAVAETVEATVELNKPWSRGLVNAVLRNFLRERSGLEEKIKTDPEAIYAHPLWWIVALKRAWPDKWETILEANNAHPPFSLRVNLQQISREAYLETLQEDAHPIVETPAGIILAEPISAEELPGFKQGQISVQDGAAQLAALLLDLQPNQRVLDACAAPGGKLTHILECEPQLAACIAVEKDKQRMHAIHENLLRLQQKATCICADASNTAAWWDKQLFDRILVDAPCSASGVIRRHPDIKLLRQPTDIKAFANVQFRLLEALWPLLKPNGLLVYATCSVFPEENTEVLQRFMAAHEEAYEVPIEAEWGMACAVGRQILPGMHEMDGFYYARVCKKQSAE